MKYPIYLCAPLLVMMGLASTVHALDSNSVRVTMKANVTASCTISASTAAVVLDAIPAADFVGKKDGDPIGNAKTFELTPTCYGKKNYKLTLTPLLTTSTACIKTSADFMRFCLSEDSKAIDFKNGSATLTKAVADGKKTFSVMPQVGKNNDVTAGDIEGGLTIIIEPQ